MSEMFRRHKPEELADIRETTLAHGRICVAIRIYYDTTLDLPNCVLDGEGRLTIAAELELPPEKVPFDFEGNLSNADANELAQTINDARRHDDPFEIQKRRAERIGRIVVARKAGESIRSIADREAVSREQVRRDLTTAGDTGVSPQAPSEIQGLDGKKYPVKSKASNTPAHFKGGDNVDRNHRFIKALNALTNFIRVMTEEMNKQGAEILLQYLTHCGLVSYSSVVIEGEERKAKNPVFRDNRLAALRRVINLAGRAGKARSQRDVRAEFERSEDGQEQ